MSSASNASTQNGGREIGGYARHYYDLYCLAERPEVLAMLRSDEYAAIRVDYDRVSREHFAKSYVPTPGMSFAKSDALFPPDGHGSLGAGIREAKRASEVLSRRGEGGSRGERGRTASQTRRWLCQGRVRAEENRGWKSPPCAEQLA